MQLVVTWKKHLFDDNLHLLGSGICTLATNFICNLNFFLREDLHHPNVHFQPTK